MVSNPDEIRRAVDANPVWYHTIELAPGVLTPGRIDLRGIAPGVLPERLDGKRALDVGTFDGFWAFELERRGADTVAIDVETIDAAEWPPVNRPRLEAEARAWGVELGRGFRIASEALGSKVERRQCSVYDVEPARIGGQVDVAFSGAILLHLRDPVGALERIGATLVPGGTLIVLEPISLRRTLLCPRRPVAEFKPLTTPFNWWYPNLAALRGWLTAAGFSEIRRRGLVRPPAERQMRQWHAALEARAPGGRA